MYAIFAYLNGPAFAIPRRALNPYARSFIPGNMFLVPLSSGVFFYRDPSAPMTHVAGDDECGFTTKFEPPF